MGKITKRFAFIVMGIFLFSVFAGYVVSPLISIPFLGQEKPTKIFLTKTNEDGKTVIPTTLITQDPEVLEEVITSLEWTWVTNMKKEPSNELAYNITFANDSNETLFPIYYYPESDVIAFPVENRKSNVKTSISSNEKVKQLLQKFENE